MPISTGYKYKTPLKSDYLNSILSSVSRPGLLRRPKATTVPISSNTGTLQLGAFDAFIIPGNSYSTSNTNTTVDAYGRRNTGMLVKATFAENSNIAVTRETAAIGIQYSNLDSNNSGSVTSKEASLVALSYEDLKNVSQFTSPWDSSSSTVSVQMKEKSTTVIVATCFYKETNSASGTLVCNSCGAMYSPLMLNAEGWTGNTYLALQSPFQSNFSSTSIFYNYLRLNSMMTGYAINPNTGLAGFINGRYGIAQMKDSNTVIDLGMFKSNSENTYTYLNSLGTFSYDGGNNAYRYHLISLDTSSLNPTLPYSLLRISNSVGTLSDLNPRDIPSSVIAVVELQSTATSYTTVNKNTFLGFKIYPVSLEPSRAIYSNSNLYIN